MEINPEIKERIQEVGIPVKDGVAYLLGVYFDTVPSTTSSVLVKQMGVTKILGLDENKQLIWNIPLFSDTSPDAKWLWVINEYREMFKRVNSQRSGPKKSCIARMKKFFKENPDVRKEEVLMATKGYIKSLTDSQYITSAHYFIYKGTGANSVSGLEDWIEKYRNHLSTTGNSSTDVTKKMQ